MRWIFVLLLFPVLCVGQSTQVSRRAALEAAQAVPAVAGGGGPTNYSYTVASADTSFATGGTFIDYLPLTNANAGTLKELTFFCNDSQNTTVNVALYDSASNLVAGASGSILTAPANNGTEVHIPIGGSVSVSATTYLVAITATTSAFRVSSLSGKTCYYKGTRVYANFPEATLPAADGTEGSGARIGMGVQ